ncbi:MAG: hypothetical protein FD144_3807 [Rhodospirillaceae bacterium]|nr:MAG: hypothetical protein FD144_3807 [Rhodospirillaceae bacterium]
MDWLLSIDWKSMFVPTVALADLAMRGLLLYGLIFALMRLVLRRQLGGIGPSDILVIVLVSEAAGNGLVPQTQSVSESAFVVLVILMCSYSIEWLQFRFPAFERLTRGPKVKLIEDGRLLRRNMRREYVTEGELMAQLREQGLEDCSQVKEACIEADGCISVIRKND